MKKLYEESESVTNAKNALENQATQKPTYAASNNAAINDTLGKILNREKFSYDINSDALYNQYKDNYIQQGKLAMMDTMGQAQTMTGGYGNSYAQSVGQQAYNAHLQNLNDKVPELEAMAYSRYNQEGQDLMNQYSLLSDNENREYNQYRDSMSDYMNERSYLQDQYNNERNYDYNKYIDDRNYDYQTERDANSDNQWQKQYEESIRQYNASYAEDKRQYNLTLRENQREFDKSLSAQTAASKLSSSGGKLSGTAGSLSVSDVEKIESTISKYISADNIASAEKYILNLRGSGAISADYADALLAMYTLGDIPDIVDTTVSNKSKGSTNKVIDTSKNAIKVNGI